MWACSILVNGKRGNLAEGKIDKWMLVADCLVPCSGYVTVYLCSSISSSSNSSSSSNNNNNNNNNKNNNNNNKNNNNSDEDVKEFPRNVLHEVTKKQAEIRSSTGTVMHTYRHTSMHIYIRTYIYVRTYLHTYIHTHTQTHTHTYIYIYIIGLKFEEETSKMLHLEHGFVWCWNLDSSGSR